MSIIHTHTLRVAISGALLALNMLSPVYAIPAYTPPPPSYNGMPASVYMPDTPVTPAPTSDSTIPSTSPTTTTHAGDGAIVVPTSTAPKTTQHVIEAGMNYHSVSNNQGDWTGQFIRGQYQADAKNRWSAELLHQHAFKDDGYYASLGNTHTFNEKWFSEVAAGVGTSASFLPRFRADANINRRWLKAGNFVTTLGTTFTKASETYEGYGIHLGGSYYFSSPWALQAGVRLEMTNPGSVYAASGYSAVTYGYNKSYLLSGRIGYGREAYQLLDSGNITNAFNSKSIGLNWRQWLGDDWGFNAGTEYYDNPYYDRTGGTFSVFKEF
jgi:YaiO family outer membrane protein